MNLDLASSLDFGDADGLRHFFFDHRVVHDQEAAALSAKYGGSFSAFGVSSSIAESQWEELMRARQGVTPQALSDWLRVHAAIHNKIYAIIAGDASQAPDLSVVDFSKADQFYDWMYVHMEVHDYEQQFLGLS